jgi:hypothetical protein
MRLSPGPRPSAAEEDEARGSSLLGRPTDAMESAAVARLCGPARGGKQADPTGLRATR